MSCSDHTCSDDFSINIFLFSHNISTQDHTIHVMILKIRIVSRGWQWLVALHAVLRRSFYVVSACAMLCALVRLVALDAVESLYVRAEVKRRF